MTLHIKCNGERFYVTTHTIDRYIERVRCLPEPTALDRERYGKEIARLVRQAGTVQVQRPDWIGTPPPDCDERTHEAVSWIIVGDDIAFPVIQKRDKVIVTCVTRGGLSGVLRTTRNRIKADQRRKRRNERLNKAWRGEGNPRWR